MDDVGYEIPTIGYVLRWGLLAALLLFISSLIVAAGASL